MRFMHLSVSEVVSLLQRRRTSSLTICLRVEMTYSMIDLFLSVSDCPGRLLKRNLSAHLGFLWISKRAYTSTSDCSSL